MHHRTEYLPWGTTMHHRTEHLPWGTTMHQRTEHLPWGTTMHHRTEHLQWGTTMHHRTEHIPWGMKNEEYPNGVTCELHIRSLLSPIKMSHICPIHLVHCPNLKLLSISSIHVLAIMQCYTTVSSVVHCVPTTRKNAPNMYTTLTMMSAISACFVISTPPIHAIPSKSIALDIHVGGSVPM